MASIEPGDGKITVNPFKISPDTLATHALSDSHHDETKEMYKALYSQCSLYHKRTRVIQMTNETTFIKNYLKLNYKNSRYFPKDVAQIEEPYYFEQGNYKFVTFPNYGRGEGKKGFIPRTNIDAIKEDIEKLFTGLPINLVFSIDCAFSENLCRYFKLFNDLKFNISILSTQFNDTDPASDFRISTSIMEDFDDNHKIFRKGSIIRQKKGSTPGALKLLSTGIRKCSNYKLDKK